CSSKDRITRVTPGSTGECVTDANEAGRRPDTARTARAASKQTREPDVPVFITGDVHVTNTRRTVCQVWLGEQHKVCRPNQRGVTVGGRTERILGPIPVDGYIFSAVVPGDGGLHRKPVHRRAQEDALPVDAVEKAGSSSVVGGLNSDSRGDERSSIGPPEDAKRSGIPLESEKRVVGRAGRGREDPLSGVRPGIGKYLSI